MVKEMPVYMDYSATTPCDERVVQEMLPYFTQYFGNTASRVHSFSWQAEGAVEQARARVAQLLQAQTREIVFTSGATEACNLALRGVFEMYAVKGNHIITTQTEHKAVLDTCKALEKKGASVTYLDVDINGIINLQQLEDAIQPHTILVAVMFANNETGILQPVAEIGAICKRRQVLFFCDATQAVGKIPVTPNEAGIDLMGCSAHKMYGPKGVGVLYIRSRNPRVKITAQLTGGGHEQNIRSGTLNVPGIVGFGKACDICTSEMEAESTRLEALRNQLKEALLQIPGSSLNGHPTLRLPHILNISFAGLNSSQLLSALNKSLALSAGSACTSGSLDPSYVLAAMGLPENLSRSALRFSLGRYTAAADIEFAIEEVTREVSNLRSQLPVFNS
jgi:cysteine desulfurase